MHFSEILGQKSIIEHLRHSSDRGRVSHAQLFVGPTGSGTLPMALAYARHILCGSDQVCHTKIDKFQHPDLHFAFPVTTNDRVKKHATSNSFMEDWRSFINETPYGSLFNWYQKIGIENKQGKIGVDEAEEIVKKLALKSYEGGFKIMIIWMAEKMNIEASNKLLKLIEEPPEKTLFLLIAEDEEQIISTILSRCQVLHFPALTEDSMIKKLESDHGLSSLQAKKIAHQSNGNWNRALHMLQEDDNELAFEKWFITWVRSAFKAKGNATVVQDLISWSDEISKTGRETQKRFLSYCSHFFRQALMANYQAPDLVFMESHTEGFQLSKFAPFVHGGNIDGIYKALEEASYHIERNGNAKIILLDLSMQLTRLLHQKDGEGKT